MLRGALFFGDVFDEFPEGRLKLFEFESPCGLDGAVDGDPEEPGAEFGASVEPGEVFVDEGEDFLDGVGGFFVVEEDASGDGEHAVVVLFVEALKSVVVLGEDAFDEEKIIVEAITFRVFVGRGQHFS